MSQDKNAEFVNNKSKLKVRNIADRLLLAFPQLFLVGGAVRDILLGLEPTDYDFSIVCEDSEINELKNEISLAVSRSVPDTSSVRIDNRIDRFRTFTLSVVGGVGECVELDFVFARKERYLGIAVKPEVFSGDLYDDLFRRDFSVNALASRDTRCSESNLIDPFGGCSALTHRSLVILHNKSFGDDPIRLIRGLKLSVRFGFEFEPLTRRLYFEAVERSWLLEVSQGRRLAEVVKILEEEDVVTLIRQLSLDHLLDQLLFPFQIEESIDPLNVITCGESDKVMNNLIFFLQQIVEDDRALFLKELPVPVRFKKCVAEKGFKV